MHITLKCHFSGTQAGPDSASNIDITDVNAMGEANTKGLLVGRAKKPDTISLAVRGLKFSWGALIFHSFSRRSSLFFSYSAPHAAASRQVRIRIRSSLLMKCLSRRATFTPPFSPSWDIQVLEAALAPARSRPLSLPHLVFASEAPMPKGKERGSEIKISKTVDL